MEYGQLNQKLQAELVVTIANEANFETAIAELALRFIVEGK